MKHKISGAWWLAALLGVLGLLLTFVYTSVRFTGWLLLGLACLVAVYRLLTLLGRKKPKLARRLGRILTACLCLGLVAAAITLGFVWKGSLGAPEAGCDYVVVLGCGVNGTEPSLSLRERIHAAHAYLTAHPDAVCIASGGQGRNEDITEASCIFRELTELGIDEGRIWQEGKSTSTVENLTFSLALIEEKTGTRPAEIAIVSSEYHLFRSGLMAGDLGLDSVGVPAETGWLSLRVNYFLREIAAVWYYFIGRIFV